LMFIPGAFAVPTDLSMTVEETVLLSAASANELNRM